jgi:hypothetical protein
VALADRLAAIAPVPGSKVFFTSGGSDSAWMHRVNWCDSAWRYGADGP